MSAWQHMGPSSPPPTARALHNIQQLPAAVGDRTTTPACCRPYAATNSCSGNHITQPHHHISHSQHGYYNGR
jgi:hypothetical protein